MRQRLLPGLQLTTDLRLVRVLGRGAMGEVWLCDSLSFGEVAVKFLAQGYSQPAAVQRFEREWAMASKIQSAHVVTMLQLGHTDGRPYIVMERLDGETLEDVLERDGPMGPGRTLRLLAQIADALEAAHHHGIVHRDIKPENILLLPRDDGFVAKVLDFGLAKPWSGGETLTQTGLLMGTPYFMSPEQVSGGGKNIDHRADLWAFAAVAYRMLSNEHPFDADNLPGLVFAITKGTYVPIEQHGDFSHLSGWFTQTFQIDREARFESAMAMILAIAPLLEQASPDQPVTLTGEAITLADPLAQTQVAPTGLDMSQLAAAQLTTDSRDPSQQHDPLSQTQQIDEHSWPELSTSPRLGDSTTQLLSRPSKGHDDLGQALTVPAPTALDSTFPLPQTASTSPPQPTRPNLRLTPVILILAGAGLFLVIVGVTAVGFVEGDGESNHTASTTSTADPVTTSRSVLPSAAKKVGASAQPNTSSQIAASAKVAPSQPDEPQPDEAAATVSHLSISCDPRCILLIDSKQVGLSPIERFELAPGKHHLTAFRKKVETRRLTITIEPGAHFKHHFSMH